MTYLKQGQVQNGQPCRSTAAPLQLPSPPPTSAPCSYIEVLTSNTSERDLVSKLDQYK